MINRIEELNSKKSDLFRDSAILGLLVYNGINCTGIILVEMLKTYFDSNLDSNAAIKPLLYVGANCAATLAGFGIFKFSQNRNKHAIDKINQEISDLSEKRLSV